VVGCPLVRVPLLHGGVLRDRLRVRPIWCPTRCLSNCREHYRTDTVFDEGLFEYDAVGYQLRLIPSNKLLARFHGPARMFLTGAHSGYLSTADPEFVQIPSVPMPDHARISEKCAW